MMFRDRYLALGGAGRVTAYGAGSLAASLAWGGLLWLACRPGPEVLVRPDHAPLLAAAYLAGTYVVWVGGAAWLWCLEQPLSALGLGRPRAAELALGLAASLLSTFAFWGLALAAGWLRFGWEAWAHTPASHLWLAAPTAAFFGFSEELLFRGYVFKTLGAGRRAIWGSALIYALTHFLRFDLAWSLWLLPVAGLTLMGAFLAWTVRRTQRLWLATGLHTGWVYLFFLADQQHWLGYPWATNWLTGGGFPPGGLLCWAMVLALWAAFRARGPGP